MRHHRGKTVATLRAGWAIGWGLAALCYRFKRNTPSRRFSRSCCRERGPGMCVFMGLPPSDERRDSVCTGVRLGPFLFRGGRKLSDERFDPLRKPSRAWDRGCVKGSAGRVGRANAAGRCLSRLRREAHSIEPGRRMTSADRRTSPTLRQNRARFHKLSAKARLTARVSATRISAPTNEGRCVRGISITVANKPLRTAGLENCCAENPAARDRIGLS
jgi:hypothetical protein